MWKFLEISRTGLTSILLHPLRSLVTAGAVVAVLLPYFVGLGISKGIQKDAEASIELGADLYVSAVQFGQKVPVSLDFKKAIESIEGVAEVVPRIVGSMAIGKNREEAVFVGLPLGKLPASIQCVSGRLPEAGKANELVVGSALAARLGLKVGAPLLPFYHNVHGEKISQVVGIFHADLPFWQANLVFTSLETASEIFNEQGAISDFLIYCRPGYGPHIRSRIMKTIFIGKKGGNGARPLVISREDLRALIPAGLLHREGIFNLHFTLALVVGILAVLVTSGLGQSERRREIGILKACGWQTDEILLRSLVESFFLSLSSASLVILLGHVWLRWLNGLWIAGIFLAGAKTVPGFRVPYQLAPVPALLSFILAFVVVMTGSLYTTWRTATVAPMAAMR